MDKQEEAYQAGYDAARDELRAALYPHGIKHPQQAEWEWMIKRVVELAAADKIIQS